MKAEKESSPLVKWFLSIEGKRAIIKDFFEKEMARLSKIWIDEFIKQEDMKKKTPKPAKLKRYYLKPGPVQIDAKTYGSKWYLCELHDPRPIMWWMSKYTAVRNSAIYIRSHGGGTLRIMLRNGKFQEERTYPKSADPRKSKG